MISRIIARLLLGEILNVYFKNRECKRKIMFSKEVEDYYMSFFNMITSLEERMWILENKIRPIIANMSSSELYSIIKIRNKNNKLIDLGKPIKDVLVRKDTILQYHLEYKNIMQVKMKKKAEEEKRRRKVAEDAFKYKKYIYEFGESESEIIKRFFN